MKRLFIASSKRCRFDTQGSVCFHSPDPRSAQKIRSTRVDLLSDACHMAHSWPPDLNTLIRISLTLDFVFFNMCKISKFFLKIIWKNLKNSKKWKRIFGKKSSQKKKETRRKRQVYNPDVCPVWSNQNSWLFWNLLK